MSMIPNTRIKIFEIPIGDKNSRGREKKKVSGDRDSEKPKNSGDPRIFLIRASAVQFRVPDTAHRAAQAEWDEIILASEGPRDQRPNTVWWLVEFERVDCVKVRRVEEGEARRMEEELKWG
jgi:hypothetical protein